MAAPNHQSHFWPTLLSLLLLIATTTTTTTAATTTTTPSTQCTNALRNPSFESPALEPWLDMATGSFSTRGLSPAQPHTGTSSYRAHSNSSSTAAPSTLTLSQSYLSLPLGATVACWAWVQSQRPAGRTRVQVFLDAESCGEPVWMVGTGAQWVRVGGHVVVKDVGGGGVGHTVAVSVQGEGVSGEGWSVAVDDVGVGAGC
ncbi:hypothetical protein DDE82_002924 [Stemphylium lycopersici]|nr:hypothetical protein DDE82_002924 [Stemphylium lycopersici]